jgi:hypothetical protein
MIHSFKITMSLIICTKLNLQTIFNYILLELVKGLDYYLEHSGTIYKCD